MGSMYTLWESPHVQLLGYSSIVGTATCVNVLLKALPLFGDTHRPVHISGKDGNISIIRAILCMCVGAASISKPTVQTIPGTSKEGTLYIGPKVGLVYVDKGLGSCVNTEALRNDQGSAG